MSKTRLIATVLLVATLFIPNTSFALATPPPAHQTIYLHYDYMVLTGRPDPHSDAPNATQIQMVIDAFAAHGINLLIDPVHNVIPEVPFLYMLPQSEGDLVSECSVANPSLGMNYTNSANLYTLKDKYFHSRDPLMHYAIFGWATVVSEPSSGFCGLSSGQSELPGSNFVVGVARFVLPRPPSGPVVYPWGLGLGSTFPNKNNAMISGGAFMHELGHNLGLHHGGSDDIIGKPNYFSVMNYMFNFGIYEGDYLGSMTPDPSLRHLDYSDQALPTLFSLSLNETAGIGAGTKDIAVVSGCPIVPDPTITGEYDCDWSQAFPNADSCEVHPVPATGPIDWNCDGTIERSNVAAEVNLLNDCSFPEFVCSPGSYTGFNDWAEVHSCIATFCSFPNFPGLPHVVG